uniref:Uncharacterized protein n=1 Tax=Panagrolaimus davidi TaxID=227884 RepID=A0A914P841_9BILA
MVHTRSSLTNILSTISISLETENLVYQIFGGKSEEPPTQIFDGRLINGFDDKFVPIFKEETGKVTKIPVELVKTYSLLELNSELFQQANTSAMNQIFSSWIRQHRQKQLKNLKLNETI